MPHLLRYTCSIFIIVLLFCVMVVGQQSVMGKNALSLVEAGKNAFEDGNYNKAQEYFEMALKRYPELESRMPKLKLLLGITAYYSGDLETARAYLSIFSNENIAKVFLSYINQHPLSMSNIVNVIKAGHSISPPLSSTTRKANDLAVFLIYSLSILSYFFFFGFLEWRRNTFTNLYLRIQHVFIKQVTTPPPQETAPLPEQAEPVEKEPSNFQKEVDFSTLLGEEVSQLADILEEEKGKESEKKQIAEKPSEESQLMEQDIRQLASKPAEEVKMKENVDITSPAQSSAEGESTKETEEKLSLEEKELSDIQKTVETTKEDIESASQVVEYTGLDKDTQFQYLMDKYGDKEKYEQEDVDEIVKVFRGIEEGAAKTK